MDTPSPEMRASDAERDHVAELLRHHLGEGRLTLAEFDERAARTYAARTHGDLSAVMRDLPHTQDGLGLGPGAPARPGLAPRPAGGAAVARSGGGGVPRSVWGSYLSTNLVLIVVWLLSSIGDGSASPWFLWVAGPWGAALAAREIRHRMG